MNWKRPALFLGVALAGFAQTRAADLITNGGFEGGSSGWTVYDQADGSGTWFIGGNSSGPNSDSSLPGASAGSFYAFTDQSGEGSHALSQGFTIPEGFTSATLSFDLFLQNQNGVAWNVGGSLDYNAVPNQHFRVDILHSGVEDPLSTEVGDLALSLLDSGTSIGWTPESFDLSSLEPGSYILRFAEVDNQFFFQGGVDNVSLVVEGGESAPVPEVQTYASLFGAGLIGLQAIRRRRAARA